MNLDQPDPVVEVSQQTRPGCEAALVEVRACEPLHHLVVDDVEELERGPRGVDGALSEHHPGPQERADLIVEVVGVLGEQPLPRRCACGSHAATLGSAPARTATSRSPTTHRATPP